MTSSFLRFVDHTQRRTTGGKTLLDEWPARRRDLYRTKHNTHNRQTSMPPVGFEPTISAGERPQNLRLRPCGHWDRQDATLHSLFYVETALHVSGGTITHHQECKQLSSTSGICHTVTAICRYRGRVGTGLSVATHSTLKPVPTLPR